MKNIHIHIKTIMAENLPTPTPSLIADLVDAVLKAPGLRVTSVEVIEANDVNMITRRVRHVVADKQASAASKETITCPACKRLISATSKGDQCPACGELL